MVSALELSFRQIKFTENTAFSRIIACFPIYKPKNRFHQDRRGGSKGEDHALHFRLGNAAVLPLAVLSFWDFLSSKKENRAGVFSVTKFLFAHVQRMPKDRSLDSFKSQQHYNAEKPFSRLFQESNKLLFTYINRIPRVSCYDRAMCIKSKRRLSLGTLKPIQPKFSIQKKWVRYYTARLISPTIWFLLSSKPWDSFPPRLIRKPFRFGQLTHSEQ